MSTVQQGGRGTGGKGDAGGGEGELRSRHLKHCPQVTILAPSALKSLATQFERQLADKGMHA